ncbi:MAG: AraC family transcriptional regulator [Opitutaceae bacterium]|nr:AraC family transcriptional regulator [Opitutaceae bacterium]
MARTPRKRVARRTFPDAACRAIASLTERIGNPSDLFSGARIGEVLLADNIVVFKRTSAAMLRPQGVTHNYHHRFELVLPLVRGGRIHVDDHSFGLVPGQAMLIFPHQFHHYLDVEAGPIRWLFITFESSWDRTLLPLRNSPRVLARRDVALLREMVGTLPGSSAVTERKLGLILKVSELLRQLLDARPAAAVVVGGAESGDPHGPLLESINVHVRANLNQPLRIADLAAHTGYSVSHLRAVFRKQYGVSLGGYMRNSRLSVAASTLAREQHGRIEDIAKTCGFDSIFTFSRAFKKALGVSPREYGRLARARAVLPHAADRG